MNDPSKACNVLFVCTHNSARSILAEALLNHFGGLRFRAFSAGSHPVGTVNQFALKTLARLNIAIDGLRSKDWTEFARPGAPALDFIFTVCDDAAGELCPVWPGRPTTAHWGVADPAARAGSDEQKLQAFSDTAMLLKRRIQLLVALPLPSLDPVAIEHEVRLIGKR